MKNFFLSLKPILRESSYSKKFLLFDDFYHNFTNGYYQFISQDTPDVFLCPSNAKYLNIVEPRNVTIRNDLSKDSGKIALLHAIAHIEYNAVDLALDACYRFRDLPYKFYSDWLEVASDEIRHFSMLKKLLDKYGVKYGDLSVHQGLFDASMKSLTLLQRMAYIPRYMEANGLDSNLLIIKKLSQIPNTEEIRKVFTTILDEEIIHVKKGDFWYKFACNQTENFSSNYFEIVNSIQPNSFKQKKNVNIEARKKAGFSDIEINNLLNQ